MDSLTAFLQSAQIAAFIELNAQLVELHHQFSTGTIGAHLDEATPTSVCPTSPVLIDAHGFPNHIPCPCENVHIGSLRGTPGPTLIASPPALIPNLRDELQKFSNLEVLVKYGNEFGPDWRHLAGASPDSLQALSRTVLLVSSHQIPKVILSREISKMVDFNSGNPVHIATRANLELMENRNFLIGRDNGEGSPAVWKISGRRRIRSLSKIVVLHVPFARAFMDEGHRIRSAESDCLGWLKYIGSPLWIVSGSSGWMPPIRWTGWVKVWEQAGWQGDQVMKHYTSTAFSHIRNRFQNAATKFDPSTGIPSPACEIDSDGYDTDQWDARKEQEALGEALRSWSNFLQQVMIRRTHRDRIWGSPLLELPEGEMKLICVRFCDVDGEVYQNYQEVIRAAVSDECRQTRDQGQDEDQVPVGPRKRRNLAVNTYRRCRIASSIPALCCVPSLKDDNWDKQPVERYRTVEARHSSPYRPHTSTLLRLSPKLLWLRDFITEHLGSSSNGSNEKLLIFSFSPTVLHCVDLVWLLLTALYYSSTPVTCSCDSSSAWIHGVFPSVRLGRSPHVIGQHCFRSFRRRITPES